ncbi:hypothetical protein [Tsukamurella pseudospumae]|uniref:Uncharacterized protein n=1 Tax=Tsukamurella pseudospumae TaxID=239498 RepID=A0A138AWA7_9ACTN|nr:hypothetical protein [Tsukamurella pseudospumae]KXP14702.1 hypothetical protein AXK60_02095 [Tsukamurella pseudospumae]
MTENQYDDEYDDDAEETRAFVLAHCAFELGVAAGSDTRADDALSDAIMASFRDGIRSAGFSRGAAVASESNTRYAPTPAVSPDVFDVYDHEGNSIEDHDFMESVCRAVPSARPFLMRKFEFLTGHEQGFPYWDGTGLEIGYENTFGITYVTPVAHYAVLAHDGVRIAFLGCIGQTINDWATALPKLREKFGAPRMTVEEVLPQLFELAWHNLA